MTISRAQAQRFYDRLGGGQDTQAFYENPALDDLVAHGGFESAQSVFEFGCGTGRFAERLLSEVLPASASYAGTDISETMIALSKRRLAPYGERVRLARTEGAMEIPLPDKSVDRVVATYVLDLLAAEDIRRLLAEAHRVLGPDGRLCLVSLAHGVTFASKIAMAAWQALYALRPVLTGGCRPTSLAGYLDESQWRLEHHRVVVRFAIPSEVVVATPV